MTLLGVIPIQEHSFFFPHAKIRQKHRFRFVLFSLVFVYFCLFMHKLNKITDYAHYKSSVFVIRFPAHGFFIHQDPPD